MTDIIIKLGGSVFSTKEKPIDFSYLNRFKEIILKYVTTGDRFGVVAGGGYTMRMYRDLAVEAGGVTNQKDLHWIGTTTNVLHAEIIRSVFGENAAERPVMYGDYYDSQKLEIEAPVIIGGGGRPGHSGDVDAILLAEKMGAKQVISLKNIDMLYSADPSIDTNAIPVKKATWQEYLDIIGNVTEHTPGGNFPIDPVASRMAREKGIAFVVLNGFDLNNFVNFMDSKEYVGSVIG